MISTPLHASEYKNPMAVFNIDKINDMNINQLKNFITYLNEEKNSYIDLINSFNDLSLKEFYVKFSKLYSVDTFELEDKVIEKFKKNSEFYKIRTDDIVEDGYKYGNGGDSFFLMYHYYAVYEIYAKKGCINPAKVYRKDEIAELVKEKKVMVMDIKPSVEQVNKKPEVVYSLSNHLKKISVTSPLLNFDEFEKIKSPSDALKNTFAMSIIRSEFSVERLNKDFEDYMKFYNKVRNDCLKKAYKIIKERKTEIKKEQKEIAILENYLSKI